MAENSRSYDFDFYSLFADEHYSKFEIDRYSFQADVDLKEAHYSDYNTHDILPHLLARKLDNGDERLEEMLGVKELKWLYSEGEKIGPLIAEDWVLEGKENIALGQACSCRYKPLKKGIPYDVRQAFWFHRQFKQSSGYNGEKELSPPHTVSVNQPPGEAGKTSFEEDMEIIVRTLEPERSEVTDPEKIKPLEILERQKQSASD